MSYKQLLLMVMKNKILLKTILLFLTLLLFEFFLTFLIYNLFPESNMNINVQIAIDLSLLIVINLGFFFFSKEQNTAIIKSNLSIKNTILFLLLTFVWVLMSPLFKYPFLSNSFNLSEIKLSLENIYFSIDKITFSGYHFLRLLLITPLLEELFFRKLILSKLNFNLGYYKSIIITSILFSISHLDINNLLIFFIGSLILCSIYLKTNKLIYSFLFHVLMNLLSLIII